MVKIFYYFLVNFFLQFYNNLCLGYNFWEFYKYSITFYMKDESKCIILLIFPEYFKEYKTSYNTKIRPVTYFFLQFLFGSCLGSNAEEFHKYLKTLV